MAVQKIKKRGCTIYGKGVSYKADSVAILNVVNKVEKSQDKKYNHFVLKCNGKVFSISKFTNLKEQLKFLGIKETDEFDFSLEYDGGKSTCRNKNKQDKNDENTFQWAGKRGEGSPPRHIMGRAPMFFQYNGSAVDLVDIYKGAGVFLCLNGPSMATLDLQIFKKPGIVTFGINNGGHTLRPNIWTCVDSPSRFMGSVWKDPAIMKIVPQAHFDKPIWDVANDRDGDYVHTFPNIVGYRRNERFQLDQWLYEDTINWGNHKQYGGGRSVMMAAVRICQLLGFARVYLVGCDFNMTKTKGYFFDEERTAQAVKNNNDSYTIMMDYFKQLKPKFDEIGFKVFNCNPKSALKVFPTISLGDALKNEEINCKESTNGMYGREAKKRNAERKKKKENEARKKAAIEAKAKAAAEAKKK